MAARIISSSSRSFLTRLSLDPRHQVQLVDEDGNRVSAALQCINGEQAIEVLVEGGAKSRVALKDLQKGSQVLGEFSFW